MSAPILLTKLPTGDVNSFDNLPINSIKFQVDSKKQKPTPCNQLQFKRKLTPIQLKKDISPTRSETLKNPIPKNMPWKTTKIFENH